MSLVIPCRPEYVGLCRLVVGALGTRDSLDEEVVADLRVIVTEACNCFLALADGGNGITAPPGCSMRLDFDSRPDAFVISVFYPERGGTDLLARRAGPVKRGRSGTDHTESPHR